MLSVIGLEVIGDDAAWREKRRKSSGTSVATTFRRALTSGRFGEMMCDSLRHEGRPRAWVARITGRDERHGLAREFLRGNKDYSGGNEDGSRGVMEWFELAEGQVFEVNAPLSWTEADRYFCRSHRGKAVRMNREELDAWLDAGCPDLTRAVAEPSNEGRTSGQ